MSFCLPIEQSKKFIQSLKDGVIDPGKLAQMASDERRTFLSKIVGEVDAKEVNALFESKLLLKNQQRGMITWAKKVAGLTETARRDLVTKIEKMDRILTPADQQSFLADLAAKKLGTEVTFEEAKKIGELSRAVAQAKNLGEETFAGVSDEYLKARTALADYIESLKPISTHAAIGKDLVTIGRNNLLLNPSTLIKTSSGQFVNTVMEGLTRRISTLSLKGDNAELASQARGEAWKTFRETGLNVAGMEGLNDTHIFTKGEALNSTKGETTAGKVVGAIETGVRKVAQVSNKIAIDWQHVTPFTKVYQTAFYDMANILSSDVAKRSGLEGVEAKAKSAEIFKDASKIEPVTEEGKLVRAQAQGNAARVTSTNQTYASMFSLKMKDTLNTIGKSIGVPLGDLILPIAKIPATIFANGVENAGLGLITGGKDFFQGYKDMQSDNLATKYEGALKFQNGYQTLARTVGTMGLAFFISQQFGPKDFKTDNFGGHYVRLGNTWINLEYITAVSPALAGMMQARSGKGVADTVYKYGAGVLSSYKAVPGVDELSQLGSTGLKQYINNFFSSRTAPAFIQQMTKDRPVNRLFFGAHGVETTQQVKADDRALAKKAAETRKANK